jgi:signal transduction histidine kinase/CheY-like chemotaxis protein
MKASLESQLRALMDALPFASWLKDSEGKFTAINQVLLHNLDKERSEVLGKESREVFDEADTKLSSEGEKEVMETGKVTEATHSRDKRVFKTVHFPVVDPRGKLTGTGGYQEDITNLTASLQALHRERETLEVLLESLPYAIFFIDTRFRYLRINSRMANLLRVPHPDQAIGKGNEAFFTRRVARKMQEEDQSVLDSGKPMFSRIIYFEDEGIRGFWMEKTKIPIRDERGVITMIVGIYKDVSEMMHIENELKQARDRAQESDRLKTAFLANMSHEIRTPMNGIVGFVNLLRDPDLTDEQRDLYLKHIEQSSNQLLNIVNDIIDISKIESGQLKITNRPVRINGVLDEIYSSFFHRIRGDAPGQQKVSFILQKGETSPDFTIVIDDSRLSQVFNNLISNAIKFTEEGHITFGYALENRRHIKFFVRDTGIGISPDKTEMIFDRFGQDFQSKVVHPSGTGLGLSISKSLVQLMGGEMWVESDVGKGSAFYFTLPLVMEESVEEGEVLISNKTYDWSGKQVLVAEDEELNWMFIREMLKKTGALVVRAKNGLEVIKMVKESMPDIILMDIKMPEMDGIEATRRIRKFDSHVPIIAQTAFVMAEEKSESMQAGCNHFLTKPLDRTILMEIIDSYFRKP